MYAERLKIVIVLPFLLKSHSGTSKREVNQLGGAVRFRKREYGSGAVGIMVRDTRSDKNDSPADNSGDVTDCVRAQAAPVFTFSNLNYVADGADYTFGVQFSVSSTITVTGLDGLFANQSVVLFSSSGTQLATATGTTANFDAAITPVTLTPGNYFVAQSVPALIALPRTFSTPSSSLSVVSVVAGAYGSGLGAYPSTTLPNDYSVEANIDATLVAGTGGGSAAPEPASLTLYGVGLTGLAALRRRRAG